MFRRIALGCLILMVLGGPAAYAQITQSSKVIKAKPPKKYKAPKVKRALKPPKLTPDGKAARKAYGKAAREQRKAFVQQQKEQANQLKAQQKAVSNAVKQAKKQAKNNK